MRVIIRILAMAIFAVIISYTATALAETAGQFIDDATISAKVKTILMADATLKPSKISVETNQGAVELSGVVDTRDQERIAEEDARKVEGVRSVTNLIKARDEAD